jgi:hypothetical protein
LKNLVSSTRWVTRCFAEFILSQLSSRNVYYFNTRFFALLRMTVREGLAMTENDCWIP